MNEFLLWLTMVKGVNPETLTTKEDCEHYFDEFVEYCKNAIKEEI